MHLHFYPRYKISTFLHSPHIGEPALHTQYSEWTEEKWFNSQQGKQIFIFSLFQNVPISTGTYPASYSMGTDGSFFSGKVARACSCPFTSIQYQSQECMQLQRNSSMCLHSMHSDNFTFFPCVASITQRILMKEILY